MFVALPAVADLNYHLITHLEIPTMITNQTPTPKAPDFLISNEKLQEFFQAAQANPATRSMTAENWFLMGASMAELYLREVYTVK